MKASTELAVTEVNRPPQSLIFSSLGLFNPLPMLPVDQLRIAAKASEFEIRNLLSPIHLALRFAQSTQPEPQGIQTDKSIRIALVIDFVFFEGRHARVVER